MKMGSGVVVHLGNPSTQKADAGDSEVSLGSTVSLIPLWTTYWDPVSALHPSPRKGLQVLREADSYSTKG